MYSCYSPKQASHWKNFPLKDSHLIKGGVLEHRLTNGDLTAGCKQ